MPPLFLPPRVISGINERKKTGGRKEREKPAAGMKPLRKL